jgi:cystathionine beta-lyase
MKKNAEEYWELDFEQMESRVTPATKALLFCNPHNPVRRVFSKEELQKVAEFCEKYDLLIVSDDVHCDIILDDTKKYIPIATLNEEIAKRTITLM